MKCEPVSINDPQFFIANVMKDCPARTVIRELLQNAIEASGPGRIEWFRFDYGGVPKLGLYNEGPGAGMDHRELNDRMNMASTGKALGFDRNFGQGAKMSAGKASPHGLLYRSCKAGVVSEIWLQLIPLARGGKALVKVPQYDEYEGEDLIVRQVTDDAAARGRRLTVDWTEAILLGRSADDNTLSGEFLGESSALWLSRLINQRYYRFPEGVTVHCATVTTERADWHRNARGLAGSLASPAITDRRECVQATHPRLGSLEIVYGRLAGKSKERRGGPLAADGLSGGSHVCLVWRDEVYDLDTDWIFQAGAYGFSGVAQDYYVHLLLPEEAPVENNNHRTEIVVQDSTSDSVVCAMFCNLVRDGRPAWILDDIRRRLDDDTSGRLQDRIRRMAEKFAAWMATPTVTPDEGAEPGAVELDSDDGEAGELPPGRGRTPADNGRRTRRGLGKPRADRPRPETITARFQTPEAVDWYEKMTGRAGAYDQGANAIYLSEEFADFKRLAAWVNEAWPDPQDNAIALKILRDEYCLFACSLGIAAISFRRDESWSPDQWQKGLTTEAISCHMRDPAGAVRTAVKTQTRSQLNARVREEAEAAHA